MRLEKVLMKEAHVRQVSALKQNKENQENTVPVHGRERKDVRENEASEQAAKAFDVSGATVQRAKRVEKNAPEVFQEMADGKISVRAAEGLSKLPKGQRKEALKLTTPLPGLSATNALY